MCKYDSLLLELKGYGEFANKQVQAIIGEQEDTARTVEIQKALLLEFKGDGELEPINKKPGTRIKNERCKP